MILVVSSKFPYLVGILQLNLFAFLPWLLAKQESKYTPYTLSPKPANPRLHTIT